jgi:hypothetical protein
LTGIRGEKMNNNKILEFFNVVGRVSPVFFGFMIIASITHSYYASKFDPELKVYFSMKKNTFFAGILEKGYTHIIKPLDGRIKHIRSEK